MHYFHVQELLNSYITSLSIIKVWWFFLWMLIIINFKFVIKHLTWISFHAFFILTYYQCWSYWQFSKFDNLVFTFYGQFFLVFYFIIIFYFKNSNFQEIHLHLIHMYNKNNIKCMYSIQSSVKSYTIVEKTYSVNFEEYIYFKLN